jgi:SAM-dependent methyltransferase
MPAVNSDLYDYPALYDALLPVRAHLPYYAELARQASGDILELACGTGQLTVPLTCEGLRVAGLDLSEPMLSIARERAAKPRGRFPPGRHSIPGAACKCASVRPKAERLKLSRRLMKGHIKERDPILNRFED